MTTFDQLAAEGSKISLLFTRVTPETATISWGVPHNPRAYSGILVVLSTAEINPSNYPTNSVKYVGSTDLASPGDMLGQAHVVAALYDDVTTAFVTVDGLQPDVVYYAAAFMVTNVRTYYLPGVRSYLEGPDSDVYAGDMVKSYGPPQNPSVGQNYFDELQKLVFVWDGTTWKPTTAHTVISGNFDPTPQFDATNKSYPKNWPELGDFFYNTTIKLLKIWTGTGWQPAESIQGTQTTSKPGVGSSSKPNVRGRMINSLKALMGWPVVCVELTDDHWNLAISNALSELRRRVDSAYEKGYVVMQLQPGQDVYYLNDPSIGTDRIVDVLKVHRLNMMGLVNFTPDNIYAQQFLNHFYAPGAAYDMVSVHLIHGLSETYTQLFAGDIAFNWREPSREVRVYRKVGTPEKVLIEVSLEKSEEELLYGRWTTNWIQQWAEAESMMILANIRGKFATLAGPNGGISLNADALRSEAQRLQEDCLRQVKEFEIGQNGPDNFYLPFVMG